MRIRDEYLHGSDLTGVVKKIEVTIGTGNNANKSVIKYTKADSEGGIVEVPIGDITGKAATASKLDNTSAIGSTTNPIYFTNKGVPSACTYSLNATVPAGAANQVLYYSAPNTLGTQSYTTLTSNLDVFTAATSSTSGKKGLVPAPSANQLGAGNFFLRADGVWTVIENKSAALNGTATSLVTTGEKYNWNSAYNWYNSMTSGDTDGIINKWKEVEAFLANYGDSSTLAAELAKLVTLSTNQTITGVKTFSEVINGSITGNADTVDGYHASAFATVEHTHNYLSVIPSKNGAWSTIESMTDPLKFKVYEVYNEEGPTPYGEVLNATGIRNHWQAQLWMAGTIGGRLYYRNKDYNDNSWGNWGTVAWTSDIPTVTDYYWADIPISATSNMNTSPTFDIPTCKYSKFTNGSEIIGYIGKGGDDNNLYFCNHKNADISILTDSNVSNCIYLKSGGNVGIGTSTPEYKLHTVGKIVSKSTRNSVQLIPDADCGLYMTSSGQWIHIAGSGGEMHIYNGTWDNVAEGNYNKGINIDTNNNIGIGITSPSYKLGVNGSANAKELYENGVRVSVSGHTHSYLPLSGGTITGTITTKDIIIPQNCKIYTYALDQVGTYRPIFGLENSGESTVGFFAYIQSPDNDSTDGVKIKSFSGSDLVTILDGGNVGIGTSYPSSKLYVAGDIYTTTGFKKEGSSDDYVLLGGGGHKAESSLSVNYATSAGNADTLDGIDSTEFLRQVIVPNNTENDFNTFSNMTLTGRCDPTTGASLKNAPWTGAGPAGGYGVLTYTFDKHGYGTQMAWGYRSNKIYIRNKAYDANNGIGWQSTWDSIALTSDIPTKVSAFDNDAKYLTSHAYSYGSIDIYDVNGAKKTSNNTVSASINTETLRLQEGANIAITAINSGDPGSDVIKIEVTGIESNINQNGYGKLALWYNGASSVSTTLQSATYNELLTVKAGSGIDFSGTDGTANTDVWTISAIPYNCAITLSNNSAKSLIKDSWSADALSIYLTSIGTSSGTSLDAGTYALWIEDRSSSSGTPNYYSGTFTCAGSATAGRLDEIALHSSMATIADTNAPTRIFVATLISSDSSNTPGKHVLRFCSLDSKATPHYLTVKVNRII